MPKEKRVQFGRLYGPGGTNLGRPSAGNDTPYKTVRNYTRNAVKAGVRCIGSVCFSDRALHSAENAVGSVFGEKQGNFGSTRRLPRVSAPRLPLTPEERQQKMLRRIWAHERKRRARNNSRALRPFGPYRPRYREKIAEKASQSGPEELFLVKSAPTPPGVMEEILGRPLSPLHNNEENGNKGHNNNENNNNEGHNNKGHATGGRTRRRHRAK